MNNDEEPVNEDSLQQRPNVEAEENIKEILIDRQENEDNIPSDPVVHSWQHVFTPILECWVFAYVILPISYWMANIILRVFQNVTGKNFVDRKFASVEEIKEKASLENAHALDYDTTMAQKEISLLDNFGSQLYLCFDEQYLGTVKYQHWFVTDLTWRIEFHELHSPVARLLVQKRTAPIKYNKHKMFEMNEDVKERMKAVCGAMNHSWMLRNSEHAARYIHCGQWISLQTEGAGSLKRHFSHLLTEKTREFLNTAPLNLIKERIQVRETWNNHIYWI